MIPATELVNGHFLNDGVKRVEPVFVMELLPGVVGWIIGRAGARIKELQQCFSCKMWVDQDVPDDQPRKLFFQGPRLNIDAAVAEVNELIGKAPLLGGRHGPVKTITCSIAECPADLVGLLIGKRGWTIKKIQSESGAQIAINQSIRNGLPRKVIVSGTEGAVHHALFLINEVLRAKVQIGDIRLTGGSAKIPTDFDMFPAESDDLFSNPFYSKSFDIAAEAESVSPSTVSGIDLSAAFKALSISRQESADNLKTSEYSLWGNNNNNAEDDSVLQEEYREQEHLFKKSVFNFSGYQEPSDDYRPILLQRNGAILPSSSSDRLQPSAIDYRLRQNQEIASHSSYSLSPYELSSSDRAGTGIIRPSRYFKGEYSSTNSMPENHSANTYAYHNSLFNGHSVHVNRSDVNRRRPSTHTVDSRAVDPGYLGRSNSSPLSHYHPFGF